MGRTVGVARLVALALVAFAIWVRVVDPVPVQIVRNLMFDYYQQLHPRPPAPFPVAILDIDDASLAEIGQWPWPRSVFADLVTKATQNGAVAIAFDVVFSEPDRMSPPMLAKALPELPGDLKAELTRLPGTDERLAEAFARSRVIVGQTSVRRIQAETGADRPVPPKVPHAVIGGDPLPHLTHFPELVENMPALEAAAAGRGLFNVRPDPDGVYRRVPIVMSVEGTLRMGLGPEMLRVATGGQPFAVRVNEAGIDGVVVAGQFIQTNGDGTVRPYLNPSNPGRYVSAGDLLNGRVPPGRLAGHLVFVGTSAIGLEDFRATPLGVQMAGVEIHAQLLENILSNSLLSRPNYAIGAELVAAFVLCLVIIILTPIMNATFLIISAMFFLSSWAIVSYSLFVNQRLLIDPSFPILCGLLSIMFMSAANYLREERRRRAIRTAFGQYVSKDLVDELSESSEGLKLGGETREITLLFSDVRGFTSIAESYRDDPGGLTRLMNRFLNLMSNAILDNRGTIDKFMGDAVMAFWNAPLDHPDHPRSACRAALRMIRDVDDLNDYRRKRAKEEERVFRAINVGIGLNTGICTVGNMGSDMRFDYTAMGDPVNLASRLEGQSRHYGAPIVVGTSTHVATQSEFAYLELDLIRVKGKQAPERVFALLGDEKMRESPEFKELRDTHQAVLDTYRAADWDAALKAMSVAEPHAMMLENRLADYYLTLRARIDVYRETPPPADWGGVYDATSK